MAANPQASRCPLCGRGAAARGANASFPFCSPACKLMDLGRWLDGSYRVAGPPVASTDELDGARLRAEEE